MARLNLSGTLGIVSSKNSTEISFLDLIEVRVVAAMRRGGISLQAIRFAIRIAQEKMGVDRPLSSRDFKTDGSEILMDAIENDGNYVSLSKKRPGQKVFREIIQQSLNDLEYDGRYAARWRPKGFVDVVIDPARNFGEPLLDSFGISTSALYTEYLEFFDLKYLSRIYELPLSAIKVAVAFEKSLDRAQTANGQSTF